jgi:cysteine sulfinate desulfinase/cysteine desulfurase-like protein
VLAALGLPEAVLRASVRIGLGRGNTEDEVDAAADRLVAAVRAQRAQRAPAARPA